MTNLENQSLQEECFQKASLEKSSNNQKQQNQNEITPSSNKINITKDIILKPVNNLKDLENFLIELGAGFTFVARQKKMVIDNTDFNLDLLFYHRKLKRLIAIDLKIGKFKASYKGQMELYLRYLEKYDTEEGEEAPIGLILCAEGNQEQIELLQLDKVNIKVAEYITKYLPKEVLTHSAVSCDTDIYSLGQTLFEMLAARSLSDEYFVHQSPGIKQTAPLDQFSLNRPATLLPWP